MDITTHWNWFENFVRERIGRAANDSGPMELKLKHTRNVLANCQYIAKNENLAPPVPRMCALAGLYHDLARFDQYLHYGTFKDAVSRNHGSWAVQLVKANNCLSEENAYARKIIQTAIGLHNRASLPSKLAGTALVVANIVRDADKLDILRVMAEHLSRPGPYNPTVVLSLPDDPAKVSQIVLQAALASKSAFYADLTSVNDFRVLLGAWFFGLNYNSSKALFIKAGHGQQVVSALPQNGAYAKVRQSLLAAFANASF